MHAHGVSSKNIWIILLLSVSCNSQKNESFKTNFATIYDFEILYHFQEEENFPDDKYRYLISSDSIYFLIETVFTNDTLIIETEKREIFRGVVNTEPSSGIAAGIVTRRIENIEAITLRINSGQPITFNLLRKEHNIVGIRKTEKKVSILFYKKVPIFY